MGTRSGKIRKHVDPTVMSTFWLIASLVLLVSVFSIFHALLS